MSFPSLRGIREILATKELLVAGVARDCSHHVEGEVARLRAALGDFGRVRWLVVESDSRDDTVQRLQRLAATVPDFGFLSLGALRRRLPRRTERIAHCRNAYLSELRADPRYARTAYVAVADLDGVNSLLTAEAVLSCWRREDWAVCTANQAGPYYDVWALRHQDWAPNDCWRQGAFLQDHGLTRQEALRAAVRSRMITIPEDGGWIEVDSAFGGFALYRREALAAGVAYAGTTETGEDVCEHTTLHAAIRRSGGRIFVNPRLVNGTGTGWAAGFLRSVSPPRQKVGLAGRTRRLVREALRGLRGSPSPDQTHRYSRFSIALPADHRLPGHQRRHERHDAFLPLLAGGLEAGTVVVDVGANCGDTLAAMADANPSLRFLCVEPDASSFSYLERNADHIRACSPGASITIARNLVGKSVGRGRLHGPGGSRGLVPGDVGEGFGGLDPCLETVPLDAVVERHLGQERVGLVKSDVDGYDWDVLDSAGAVLARDHPILYFECQVDDDRQKRGFEDLLVRLWELSYARAWVFDNFGGLMLCAESPEPLRQLVEYLSRQASGDETRTIRYYDVLACVPADEDRVGRIVAAHLARR